MKQIRYIIYLIFFILLFPFYQDFKFIIYWKYIDFIFSIYKKNFLFIMYHFTGIILYIFFEQNEFLLIDFSFLFYILYQYFYSVYTKIFFYITWFFIRIFLLFYFICISFFKSHSIQLVLGYYILFYIGIIWTLQLFRIYNFNNNYNSLALLLSIIIYKILSLKNFLLLNIFIFIQFLNDNSNLSSFCSIINTLFYLKQININFYYSILLFIFIYKKYNSILLYLLYSLNILIIIIKNFNSIYFLPYLFISYLIKKIYRHDLSWYLCNSFYLYLFFQN